MSVAEKSTTSRGSQPYQKMLEELEKGPRTRGYLMRELAKYFPFEKALRRVERSRTRAYVLKGEPVRPRKRFITREEQIYHGRRMLVGEIIQTAVAAGRVVVDRIDHPDNTVNAGRPKDIVRLRRPDEPRTARHLKRLATQQEYKRKPKDGPQEEPAS